MKKILTVLFVIIGFCSVAQTDSIRVFSLAYEKMVGDTLWKATRIKPDKPIEEIIAKLNSKDVDSKSITIEYLSKVDDNKQIPFIESLLLNDASENIRAESAIALMMLRSESSISALKRALNDTSKEVQIQVAASLAFLGEKTECLKIFIKFFPTGNRREKLICNKGYMNISTNDAIEMLKKSTTDNDDYIVIDAAIMLAQLGYYEEALPILKLLGNNQDKHIRCAVIRGYSYINSDESFKLISKYLHDEELYVRNRCIQTLRNYNKKVSVKQLYGYYENL